MKTKAWLAVLVVTLASIVIYSTRVSRPRQKASGSIEQPVANPPFSAEVLANGGAAPSNAEAQGRPRDDTTVIGGKTVADFIRQDSPIEICKSTRFGARVLANTLECEIRKSDIRRAGNAEGTFAVTRVGGQSGESMVTLAFGEPPFTYSIVVEVKNEGDSTFRLVAERSITSDEGKSIDVESFRAAHAERLAALDWFEVLITLTTTSESAPPAAP